jgi:hypothetical protein
MLLLDGLVDRSDWTWIEGGCNFPRMSTFAEIEEVLPRLTVEELMRVESLLHKLQRQRHAGVIYDDAYGVWTDEDQASISVEAWDTLDGKIPEK